MTTRASFASMLLCGALAGTAAAAPERDETVLGGEIEHGGYGGPRIGYTRIAGNDAMLVGGEGGWILNHHFIIGGAGFGLVTQQPAPGALATTDDLSLGYGGLLVGYTVRPHHLVHGTFGVLVGGGGVGSHARAGGASRAGNDAFFVLEPNATMEVNLVEHVRAGLGLSLRLVRGIDTDGLSNGDLSGVTGSMIVKFGKF